MMARAIRLLRLALYGFVWRRWPDHRWPGRSIRRSLPQRWVRTVTARTVPAAARSCTPRCPGGSRLWGRGRGRRWRKRLRASL